MSLSVSTSFIEAQAADANNPRAEVHLVLGNYFNSVAYLTSIPASSVNGSGIYPATGANDGQADLFSFNHA